MKKAGILVLYLFLAMLLSWQASAMVGVSPAIYEIDFVPGLKQQFVFGYRFDDGVESQVYAEGDLAEYVTLSTNKLVGSGGVIANLELPESIEVPGDHKLFIGAKQVTSAGGNVGIVGNVRGVILVRVPYPGKYAVISKFDTTNANQGEPINFTLEVDNLGKESVTVDASVEIYNNKNKSVETLSLGSASIEPATNKVFFQQLDTKNYQAGDFRAVAKVKYEGGELSRQNTFRLGTLYIGISNYTKQFERDKINKFDIEVESSWNDQIENVHANVQIIGYDIQFLTPSITLQPWSKGQLSGFFDTTGIEESKFKANVTISYAGRKTSEIVNLKFKNENNYVLYALIGGGVFIGILVISLIIVLIILVVRKNISTAQKETRTSKKNVKGNRQK